MCQTARRRMEGLWREGCERIESCQERWRGRKRKGTMLATLKARPALMTMTMTVEDVERTRCVLLRALRELIIEDCQIARLKIQIQNIPTSIIARLLRFQLTLPILFLRPSKLTDYLSNSKVFPSAERTRQLVGEKSIRSLGSKPRPALLAICCIANDIYSSAVPTVPHFLPAAAFDQ